VGVLAHKRSRSNKKIGNEGKVIDNFNVQNIIQADNSEIRFKNHNSERETDFGGPHRSFIVMMLALDS